MTTEPDDDLVPVSVRLGAVVPPEDPEDWTRPLTWVAALGMLAGPIVTFGWFLFARPTSAEAVPATFLVWEGDAAEAIVEASVAEQADVIVLGSRPRTNLRRLILGSVSSEVVRLAPCEVVVVPG